MNKIKYPAIAVTLMLLAYCNTSKKTGSTPGNTPEVVYVPSAKQMEVVEKRWPASTAEEVKEGQTIFVTKCTKCHAPYEITGFSEKKWLHEIDDMSPKAKLTPEEKLRLTKHILSYREANTVAKAN